MIGGAMGHGHPSKGWTLRSWRWSFDHTIFCFTGLPPQCQTFKKGDIEDIIISASKHRRILNIYKSILPGSIYTEGGASQSARSTGRNPFAMKLPTCYIIFVYLTIVYVTVMLGSIPWTTPYFTGWTPWCLDPWPVTICPGGSQKACGCWISWVSAPCTQCRGSRVVGIRRNWVSDHFNYIL